METDLRADHMHAKNCVVRVAMSEQNLTNSSRCVMNELVKLSTEKLNLKYVYIYYVSYMQKEIQKIFSEYEKELYIIIRKSKSNI